MTTKRLGYFADAFVYICRSMVCNLYMRGAYLLHVYLPFFWCSIAVVYGAFTLNVMELCAFHGDILRFGCADAVKSSQYAS